MDVVEWISTAIQLGILGVSLFVVGALIWNWLSTTRTGDRSDDGYEPRVHHDPMMISETASEAAFGEGPAQSRTAPRRPW